MFYKFESREQFDNWHNNIKEQLGYPLADGITVEYTELLQKDNGELFAFVDDELADGLIVTDKPADKERS